MNHKPTKKDIEQLIQKLEGFNETTGEDEIEELSDIVSLVMDLGAGWTPTLKQLLDIDSPLNIELLNYLIDSIDTQKIKVIYSSGILRYTHTYKDNITGWENLYKKLYQECLEKTLDTDDIFYGLKLKETNNE